MSRLLGIDFGTSNTSISYLENGKSKILLYKDCNLIPSLISFNQNSVQCGLNANGNILRSFKKFIPNQNKDLFFNYSIDQILIFYFTYLKNIIIEKLGPFKFKCVISVPSKFDNFSRNRIKKAYEAVGFVVLRIVNEPTAAALSYGLHKGINDLKILVVDMGGGTTDLSILEVDENFFEVVDSYGNNSLGGENFNNNLISFLQNELNTNDNIWELAEKTKRKINILDDFIIKYNQKEIKITKKIFNQINEININKLEDLLNKVKISHMIDKIILVGGGCNLKIISETICKIFKMNPLKSQQLQNCVSQGCCYYAGYLENKLESSDELTLVDCSPLSLGVELLDGNFSIIIPRNTPLPAKITKKYTTDLPGGNDINIKIYQGERKMVKDNIFIGEFNFDKLTACTQPIISVTFKLDLNNLIHIIVKDEKSEKQEDYFIRNDNNISDKELDEMVTLAEEKFQEDLNESLLKEKKFIAKNILEKKINHLDTNMLIKEDVKKEEILKNYKILDELDSYSINELNSIIENNIIVEENNEDDFMDIDLTNEIIEENKLKLQNIIDNLIKKDNLEDNELQFIKESSQLLEISNINNNLLENQINLYEKIKRRNYEEEFNYLTTYLLENLDDFELSDIKKNKLKKFIIEIISSEIKDYKNVINEINDFSKSLFL